MYLLLASIIIIILVVAFYKLKYPFWSRQPVFHFHNLRYWLFPPGIIQHNKPEKDKFYDDKIYFNNFFLLFPYLHETKHILSPNVGISVQFVDVV